MAFPQTAEHPTPVVKRILTTFTALEYLPWHGQVHYVSPRRVARELRAFHKGPRSHSQEVALHRLRQATRIPDLGTDILFKMFNDIDQVFFNGGLKGHVYLRWKSDRAMAKDGGFGGAYSAQDASTNKWTICLNSNFMLLERSGVDAFKQLMESVLHEGCVSA